MSKHYFIFQCLILTADISISAVVDTPSSSIPEVLDVVENSNATDQLNSSSATFNDNGNQNEEEISLNQSQEVTRALNHTLKDYDKRLRPNFNGKPVIVSTSIAIHSLGPINIMDMKYDITVIFRQEWNDPRLKFNKTFGSLTLKGEMYESIWIPDTFFRHTINGFRHDALSPNILLRVSPNGDILCSSRISLYIKCSMDFTYFPMDIQFCPLLIESFSYTKENLQLRWKNIGNKDPYEKDEYFSFLSPYNLWSINYNSYNRSMATGSFSALSLNFTLHREVAVIILGDYLPTTLTVVVSWVNFWLDPQAIPARASIAVTTVLTVTMCISQTSANLPRGGAIKALDLYYGICFLYVVCALGEFAIVCYLNTSQFKREKKKDLKKLVKNSEENIEEILTCLEYIQDVKLRFKRVNFKQMANRKIKLLKGIIKRQSKANHEWRKQINIDVNKIDLYSRILFPLTFLLSVCTYASAYHKELNFADSLEKEVEQIL